MDGAMLRTSVVSLASGVAPQWWLISPDDLIVGGGKEGKHTCYSDSQVVPTAQPRIPARVFPN